MHWGIVHVQHKVVVSLPIKATSPEDWLLVPDAVFESEEDEHPVLSSHSLSLQQELHVNRAQSGLVFTP